MLWMRWVSVSVVHVGSAVSYSVRYSRSVLLVSSLSVPASVSVSGLSATVGSVTAADSCCGSPRVGPVVSVHPSYGATEVRISLMTWSSVYVERSSLIASATVAGVVGSVECCVVWVMGCVVQLWVPYSGDVVTDCPSTAVIGGITDKTHPDDKLEP